MNSKHKDSDNLDKVCEWYCGKEACLIQVCLQRYDNQESKCKPIIDAWKLCCDKAKAKVIT